MTDQDLVGSSSDTYTGLSDLSILVWMGGPVCYAVCWAFYNGLYSIFGVEPEEGGIDFEFLAVRAGVLMVAVISVAALAVIVTRMSSALRENSTSDQRAIDAAFLLILLLLWVLSCLVGYGMLLSWTGWPRPLLAVLSVPAAFAFSVLVVVMTFVGLGFNRVGGTGQPRLSMGYIVIVLICLTLLLMSGALQVGSSYGERLASGEIVRSYILNTRYIFVAESGAEELLDASLVDPGRVREMPEHELRKACLVSIGVSDSFVLAYSPETETLARLSDEVSVALSSPVIDSTCESIDWDD